MSHLTRRTLLGTAGGLALGAAVPVTAMAAPTYREGRRSTLHRWARDTWHCMVAMTDPLTGLIADNIYGGQAMVLGSLGNVAGHRVLQRSFTVGDALRIRPVIAPEIFVS